MKRQTDRNKCYRQAETAMDRQKKQIDRQTQIKRQKEIDRQTETATKKERYRQTDRQTETEGKTDQIS